MPGVTIPILGDGDEPSPRGRVFGSHADGRARPETVDDDWLLGREVNVVRRADGIGVAGDDGGAGNMHRAFRVHAASGVVSGGIS